MRRVVLALVVTVLAHHFGDCHAADKEIHPTPPASKPFQDSQTGLTFPEQIGELTRDAVKEFSHAKLGVGIRYRLGDSMTADIIIYNLGLEMIPSDPNSKVIREEADKSFGNVQAQAREVYYPNLTVEHRDVVPLAKDKRSPKAR